MLYRHTVWYALVLKQYFGMLYRHTVWYALEYFGMLYRHTLMAIACYEAKFVCYITFSSSLSIPFCSCHPYRPPWLPLPLPHLPPLLSLPPSLSSHPLILPPSPSLSISPSLAPCCGWSDCLYTMVFWLYTSSLPSPLWSKTPYYVMGYWISMSAGDMYM